MENDPSKSPSKGFALGEQEKKPEKKRSGGCC